MKTHLFRLETVPSRDRPTRKADFNNTNILTAPEQPKRFVPT